jgi:hypothetical protein
MARRVKLKPGEVLEIVHEGGVCLRVASREDDYGEVDILVDMASRHLGYRWGERARDEIGLIDPSVWD